MRLQPREALEISGVTARNYDDGTRLRAFSAFPPTSQGRSRQFDCDDVLAMSVQAQLCHLGVTNKKSWEIASDLRVRLRQAGEDCQELYVAEGHDGKPSNVLTRPPADRRFFVVRVAELRVQITRDVAERLKRAAAN